jgi:hypothetical protein
MGLQSTIEYGVSTSALPCPRSRLMGMSLSWLSTVVNWWLRVSEHPKRMSTWLIRPQINPWHRWRIPFHPGSHYHHQRRLVGNLPRIFCHHLRHQSKRDVSLITSQPKNQRLHPDEPHAALWRHQAFRRVQRLPSSRQERKEAWRCRYDLRLASSIRVSNRGFCKRNLRG